MFVILKILKWCSTVFDVLQCIPFNQEKWWQPRGDRQRLYRLACAGQSCCYDFIWYLESTHHPVTVTNEGSIGIPEPKNMICFLWLLLGFGEYPYDTTDVDQTPEARHAGGTAAASCPSGCCCVCHLSQMFLDDCSTVPSVSRYQIWAHFLVCLKDLKGGVWKGPQILNPLEDSGLYT